MTSERQTVPFLDLGIQERAIRRPVAAAWKRILENCSFVGGVEVTDFEQEFARYSGTANCVGVANGTDALVIALHALDIGRGDEVITTPFTFVATAEVIVLLGATPVFVDIEPDTCNIDAKQIDALISNRTAARARKDFGESDRIRDELAAMGVVIKDSKEGTTWEIAR